MSGSIFQRRVWQPVNCTEKLYNSLLICEKPAEETGTPLLLDPIVQCHRSYVYHNGWCLRLRDKNINNVRANVTTSLQITGTNVRRLLSAWSLPKYILGMYSSTLQIMIDTGVSECLCYNTSDIFYIELKTWREYPCNCHAPVMKLLVDKPRFIPQMDILHQCENGNYIFLSSICNRMFSCNDTDDDLVCSSICSSGEQCAVQCNINDGCTCSADYFQCLLGGCVNKMLVCDGVINCYSDDSDEVGCSDVYSKFWISVLDYSVTYTDDAYTYCNSFRGERYLKGKICVFERNVYGDPLHCIDTEHLRYCMNFQCPSHFKCMDSYCIPTRMVCDGIRDCPSGEDETSCDQFSCRGYIKCKDSHQCIHLNDICDGVVQCLDHMDDEMFCHSTNCPRNCICTKYSVRCDGAVIDSFSSFPRTLKLLHIQRCSLPDQLATNFPMLQWLELSDIHTNRKFEETMFNNSVYVQKLNLTRCGIIEVKMVTQHLQILNTIDLTGSKLYVIKTHSFNVVPLQYVLLSKCYIKYIENYAFCGSTNILLLQLNDNFISYIRYETFMCLLDVKLLDIRGNQLTDIDANSLHMFAAVKFDDNKMLCCYLKYTQICNLLHHPPDISITDTSCKPIITDFIWFKVFIGVIGVSIMLLTAVTLIVKYRNQTKNKTVTFIMFISLGEGIIGFYMATILISNELQIHLMSNIFMRTSIIGYNRFISILPVLSLLVTRVEIVLMTFKMFVSTCCFFTENLISKNFNNIAKLSHLLLCLSLVVFSTLNVTYINTSQTIAWLPYSMQSESVYHYFFKLAFPLAFTIITLILQFIINVKMFLYVSKNEMKSQPRKESMSLKVKRRLVIHMLSQLLTALVTVLLILLESMGGDLTRFSRQLIVIILLPVSSIVNFIVYI